MQFPFSKARDEHTRTGPHPDNCKTQMAEAFRNFQQCIQHCDKAVFFTDEAGILQRVNPAFEKLTGYSATESVGKDLSWMAAGEPLSQSYRKIWQDIFEGKTFSGTLHIRRRDGTSLFIQLMAIPVRDTKGRITNLVCTGEEAHACGATQCQSAQHQCRPAPTLAFRPLHDLNDVLVSLSREVQSAIRSLPPDTALRQQLERIRFDAERAADLARAACSPEPPAQARAATAGAD
jgi:PAS domain S-box-containing protein